ncbi:MAG: GlsB/YeaQ/YmgE family stress response membrane protein [Rhodopirellula sp.]|nr:GlsB/YeaQ/YmgE family stress response membrane protein [Rhodopirellula sp.]
MPEFQLSPTAQQCVNVVLIWVGFGTLAGLLARSLVPGREPAGVVGTIVIGILGSTAGPLGLTYLLNQSDFNPISPLGFLAAIAGAFVLLTAYRVLLAIRRPVEEE